MPPELDPFSGIPGYPIEDLKLSNIYIETVGGGTADMAADRRRPNSKTAIPSRAASAPCPLRDSFCATCATWR